MGKWKKWDSEANERFLTLRAKGIMYKDIAKDMDRTTTAIKSQASKLRSIKSFEEWYTEFGITNTKNSYVDRQPWNFDPVLELLELRATGMSYKDIAASMGRTESSVSSQACRMQKVKRFDEWFEEFGIDY